MFDHILVPTDGSELSRRAVNLAIEFARKTGAVLTVFFASTELAIPHPVGFGVEGTRADPIVTPEQVAENVERHTREVLDPVIQSAQQAGIRCKALSVRSDTPYQAIIDAAKTQGCDMIIMASHGRSGISAMLLGSETQKVLTHSTIPVLVVR